MVSSQYSQASGKQGQTFMNAEFHRKISDAFVFSIRGLGIINGVLNLLLVAFLHPLQVGEEAFIDGQFLQPFLGNFGGKNQRVTAGIVPEPGVDPAEQFHRVPLP